MKISRIGIPVAQITNILLGEKIIIKLKTSGQKTLLLKKKESLIDLTIMQPYKHITWEKL